MSILCVKAAYICKSTLTCRFASSSDWDRDWVEPREDRDGVNDTAFPFASRSLTPRTFPSVSSGSRRLHSPNRSEPDWHLRAIESIAPYRMRSQAASSSCWRGIPRNSNSRINVSSIKLFGQDAPAVMPTTAGPGGSQKCETTSRFSCKL